MRKIILLIFMLLNSMLYADSIWEGTLGSNLWSNNDNWKDNVVPVVNDDIYITNVSKTSNMVVDVQSDVHSINFETNKNFYIEGNDNLFLSKSIISSVNAQKQYTVNNIYILDDIVINSKNKDSIITLNNVKTENVIVKTGQGTLDLSTSNENIKDYISNNGTTFIGHKTLTIDGELSLSNSHLKLAITNNNNGTIQVDGQVDIQNTDIIMEDFTYPISLNDKFWLLINNSDLNTSGYFINHPEGSSIMIGGQSMIFYYGADFQSGNLFGGNDILLAHPIPEPTTGLLLLISSGFLFVKRTRKIVH